MKTFSSTNLPPGRTVRVGGREIWVAEIGSGPPLLMLHGGGPGAAGVANFERNLDALAERFRLIVPDMPGYGRSTKGLDRKDPFGDLAGAMLGLLDALGVSEGPCARQFARRRLRAADGARRAASASTASSCSGRAASTPRAACRRRG